MAKVTFILGLCGSGKSHLADEMERTGAKKYDEGFAAEGRLEGNAHDLAEALRGGKDCVVVEIVFCHRQTRDLIVQFLRAQAPTANVEWIAFENDLATANENGRRRRNKSDPEGHIGLNYRMSPYYTIPFGVTPRPNYRLSEEEK